LTPCDVKSKDKPEDSGLSMNNHFFLELVQENQL